jgi:subtilisin family serine protease
MKVWKWGLLALTVLVGATGMTASAQSGQIAINVVTKGAVTAAVRDDLQRYGSITDVIPEINGVTMRAPASALAAIASRPYVAAANPDAERKGSPIDLVAPSNFSGGISMWNLDAVNVTNPQAGPDRVEPRTGAGVYVAVLDSGLVDTWRQYFPQERIATQFAKAFASPIEHSSAEPTNQWEHDVNSHGTHVTSTILGFNLAGTPVNGVAPGATIIPVKVLGQTGSGFTSMIAKGIVYVVNLKRSGALGNAPLVINMSLGGSLLDALEKAAVDYAASSGVTIIAAAGNEGDAGMSFPGAYKPVVSVGAAGWRGQWTSASWWTGDVPEARRPSDPSYADRFYMADFSSRAKKGQDLDVVAPGSWVVGPYKLTSGNALSYFYVSGTSQASPHVAGIVALMLQKNATLTPSQVEAILESAAIPMGTGCVDVLEPGATVEQCWASDAIGHGLITADAAIKATP